MSGHEDIQCGRCPLCGYLSFPIQELSPCGHDSSPERLDLDQLGEVYSWTRSWSADLATTVVMADFFGGALRVTAPLEAATDVEIGDSVRLHVGADSPYVFTKASRAPHG